MGMSHKYKDSEYKSEEAFLYSEGWTFPLRW